MDCKTVEENLREMHITYAKLLGELNEIQREKEESQSDGSNVIEVDFEKKNRKI